MKTGLTSSKRAVSSLGGLKTCTGQFEPVFEHF
jgi:hypothetical protein